jgi:alanine racemase
LKQLVVNKEDLKHNINRIKDYTKKISNDDNYTIIAVVKGNGYGLGLNEYSEVLVENGIKYLAVATFEEAIELRKKQKDVNILMMSPLYNKQELEETVKNNITIAIDSKENAEAVNELAHKGYNIKVHLKIDTGFGRYGFIYDDYENILNTVQSLKPNVEIEGIFTHCSDAYRKNNKHTLEQFKRFTDVIEKLEANNIKIKLKHICNSPAILNYPEMHLTAARIGSAFVGRVCSENNIGLKKIGELEINIAEVKDIPKGFNISYLNSYKTKDKTRIAIIPIGYLEGYNVTQKTDMFRIADKLRRALHELKSIFKKQKITVVINEKRYNVIGTIRNVPYNS